MSDPFGPAGPTPPQFPPPAAGAWPGPAPAPPSGPPEFLQPKYVIGLAIAAALLLIAGITVIVIKGGDDSAATRQTSTTSTAAPTTSAVLVTTPLPLPATTTTSTSTTSTSTTTTSSLPPPEAVANAGEDLAVDAAAEVVLTALDLSDENQSVVWRQVGGPDITEGRGRLIGAEATFVAPTRPTTLRFKVVVTGRGGDVAEDEIRVDVYEQADRALFVDGVDGATDGDGSRANPYRDLAMAIDVANARRDGTDIYLRATPSAYAVVAEIRGGSSLYGGYGGDWVKAEGSRSLIGGGLLITGSGPVVISAIELRGFNDSGAPVLGAVGADSLRIEDSVVRAGNSSTDANVAVYIDAVGTVAVVGSEIYAGQAGSGADGSRAADPDPPLVDGAIGNNANGPVGGAMLGGLPATRGGDGGEGQVEGDPGGAGAEGGLSGEDGTPGGGGPGGAPGRGGGGGVGLADDGLIGAPGATGLPGKDGTPGGGGGGGGGLLVHDGGGGGGGGAGGQGGPPGLGGQGGGASIALVVQDVGRLELHGSVVVGGLGGDGGEGGSPRRGSGGGAGGLGAPGVSSFLDTAGAGAAGGGGGAGGEGGWGGGGAGGPSIGMLTIDVSTVLVSDTTINAGQGGAGGSGGQPSRGGADGGDGELDGLGGSGGAGFGDRLGEAAPQSSGGDSIGWRDDGDARREIVGSTITAGTPGAAGGEGGPIGRSIHTSF